MQKGEKKIETRVQVRGKERLLRGQSIIQKKDTDETAPQNLEGREIWEVVTRVTKT